ncbi:heterokaryon incompatibility protein-domain-containing protein [Immersiella caudata]|uniref:Heterokaryon incompatibility protein-domain-containing protein n=1 Tax=Immersiella caudata TaxID=314043 RepID=A0AA40CBR8_9PEZI|nr:heterokaryon incompatibility protein-domain-containing protein [Immersiella caudata]
MNDQKAMGFGRGMRTRLPAILNELFPAHNCSACSDPDSISRFLYSLPFDNKRPRERLCARCRFLENVVRVCVAKRILPLAHDLATCGEVRGAVSTQKNPLHPNQWGRIGWHSGGYFSDEFRFQSKDFRIFSLPGTPKPFSGMISKEPLRKVTPDSCIDDVRSWMDLCESSHDCLPSIPSSLPKRVIDVGSLAGPFVKLVESKDSLELYACLSHCWGDSRPPCLTTTKTIERNMWGIEWGLLPATFQDAIDFTRRLGIRFLWIDSICIIQDSTEDWQEQSSLMADIYGNAFVTLCATASASGDGGFYPPLHEYQHHCKIDVRGRYNRTFSVIVETDLEIGHIPSWNKSARVDGRENFPLLKRAWSFQERLLSPRLVHFMRGEVMWECFELASCQCSKTYPPRSFPGSSPFLEFNDKSQHKDLARVKPPVRNLHRGLFLDSQWKFIVQAYSGLHLTRETDKLPALSGIAKRERDRRNGEEYLAGLWRSTLYEELQWSAVISETMRPREKRCPSWSWAALNGSTSHDIYPGTCKVSSIREASVTLAGLDPTGAVSDGYIVITGPTAVVQYMGFDKHRPEIQRNGHTEPFQVDCKHDFDEHEPGKVRVGDSLTCLQICRLQSRDREWHESFDLILRVREAETGSNPLTYERVGCIRAKRSRVEEMDAHWHSKWPKRETLRIV